MCRLPISSNWRRKSFGRVSAGYLETNVCRRWGGASLPSFGKRWAIGADLWTVRQRGLHVLFDLRHYQALTGHLTAYYEAPWYDPQIRCQRRAISCR